MTVVIVYLIFVAVALAVLAALGLFGQWLEHRHDSHVDAFLDGYEAGYNDHAADVADSESP